MMNGYIKQIATKRMCLKQDFPRISWENLGKNGLSPEIWGIPEILGAVGTLLINIPPSQSKVCCRSLCHLHLEDQCHPFHGASLHLHHQQPWLL